MGTCERGGGARELPKASNDKNTTKHHNQVGARVSESSTEEQGQVLDDGGLRSKRAMPKKRALWLGCGLSGQLCEAEGKGGSRFVSPRSLFSSSSSVARRSFVICCLSAPYRISGRVAHLVLHAYTQAHIP